jgi:nucleoside-diphosphate-sugar epimerase
VDTTYVSNAVDALVAALDHCEEAHGQALVVSNGEPRPISEIFAAFCIAAGVSPSGPRVPTRLALAAGTVVQTLWPLRRGDESDPPVTRFLVEQLSTAHWFDQRHTRAVLGWRPRVSIDAGLAELARWHRARGHLTVATEANPQTS